MTSFVTTGNKKACVADALLFRAEKYYTYKPGCNVHNHKGSPFGKYEWMKGVGGWVRGSMNQKEEIMNALVGFPGGALRISPVETQPNPLPPGTGPDTPRSNTCMRGPSCVFWKQCPTAPTTCG